MCPRLKHLNLARNEKLTDLSALVLCSSLESLDCTRCVALRDFTPLGVLKNFGKLKVAYGSDVKRGYLLPKSKSLQELYLPYCTNLPDVESLAYCPAVTTVSFAGCRRLKDLSALQGLRNLQEVYLGPRCQERFSTPLQAQRSPQSGDCGV